MYLPKTCGNIRSRHVTPLWLFLLCTACGPGSSAETLRIIGHELAECPLPESGARLELEALGPFHASPDSVELFDIAASDQALRFPDETQAVRGLVETDSGERFIGLGTRLQENELHVLFWPQNQPCVLWRTDADDYYPTPGSGQSLGLSADGRWLLVAGSAAGMSSAVSGAMSFDADTGGVSVLDPREPSTLLVSARSFAPIAGLGEDLVVTGGVDPTISFSSGRRRMWASAEVFSTQDMAFLEERRIELAQGPRAGHAAVTLPDKSTLLLGGVTQLGEAGEEAITAGLERLSAEEAVTRPFGNLERGRVNPAVVTLSDGRLLVAGGEDLEGSLVLPEWLDEDGQQLELTSSGFSPRFDQAFVAMPGGAALAVGGCEERLPEDGESCAMCRRGCPPLDDDDVQWDGFWIDAGGEATRFELPFAVARPKLIAGVDGAPWLLAVDPEQTRAPLYRFNPWQQAFESTPISVAVGNADALNVASLDPGSFVWLEERGSGVTLWGMRTTTRNLLSSDVELISEVASEDAQRPLHLAPGAGHQPDDAPGVALESQLHNGKTLRGLALSKGSVWVTDTLYADYELVLTLEAGSAPRLLFAPGQPGCSWPPGSGDPPRLLRAERSETELVLSDGTAQRRCTVTSDPLPIGLGAPDAPDFSAFLRALVIRRRATATP